MENIKDFNTDIFRLFDDRWGLLAAGSPDDFNAMTISWGAMGTLWGPRTNGRQTLTVYVKPSRYTFQFLEKHDYFTVSFLPEQYRKDLAHMGTTSGRDGDKLAATSLTAKALSHDTVGFDKAEATFVCRKIYSDQFDVEKVPAEVREAYYNGEAAHYIFIGQIVDFEVK